MTDKPEVLILREARRILEKPEAWTKGASIGEKKPILAYRPLTAVLAICGVSEEPDNTPGRNGALVLLGRSIPDSWERDPNARAEWCRFEKHPTTTHADVLAAFDKAIALASSPRPAQPIELATSKS